ncbi:MAG: YybS family protein [Negativicoccus succinicivorans]|uniref:YybS family protein n=1 Tax=Negativicoccus succinicivorans TaxID=620903 RepID=UPI00290FB982|nr:YybS family protein [Negativicoccus succinicivorans]MDU5915342.1 YybS family protein [Negativicoccus succinicivorans]
MPQRSTRALTEAGLLVGLTVVLSLVGTYVPILSAVALLLWPVPIAYLGVRYGMRWSLLATVATLFILTLLTGPVTAAGIGLTFGAMALTLGEGFRQKWSAGRILTVATIVFLLGFGIQFLLSFYVMGVNVFAMYEDAMRQSTEQAFRTLEGMGYNSIDLAEAKSQYLAQQAQIRQVAPFIVVSAGLLLSYLDIIIARAILRRLQIDLPKFPPVAEWEMPRAALYLYVFALLLGWFGPQYFPQLPVEVAMNIQVAAMYLIWLQGIAVVFWWARRHPRLAFMRWVIVVGSFIIPTFLGFLFLIGLIDMGINYRKRKGYTPTNGIS